MSTVAGGNLPPAGEIWRGRLRCNEKFDSLAKTLFGVVVIPLSSLVTAQRGQHLASQKTRQIAKARIVYPVLSDNGRLVEFQLIGPDTGQVQVTLDRQFGHILWRFVAN